jgi:ethylbenzene dioxygenase alpha subunit
MMTFSPAGLFEMDDGENWEAATRANRGVVTRRQPLHYGLGLGSRIDHPELPGNVYQGQINDANQRAFYQRWSDLIQAATWDELDQRPDSVQRPDSGKRPDSGQCPDSGRP